MKDLQKLTGAKILGKKEQKSVKGGIPIDGGECTGGYDCPYGLCCSYYGRCIDPTPVGGVTHCSPE